MKKKFNSIFLFFVYLLFTINAHALDSKCKSLMTNIKNNEPKLEIDELDYIIIENPNIKFETVYSEEKDDWFYFRDENKNLEISKLFETDFLPNYVSDASKSLQPGDKLLSINKILVSTLTDNEIDNILEPYYEMDQDLINSIEFEFLNSYGEKVITSGKIIENDGQAEGDVSIRIKNISDINVKKNTFEADLSIKVGWEKENLYELSKNFLIYNKEKSEYWYCVYTPSEFEQMQIGEIYFEPINSIKLNENLIKDKYKFEISDYLYDFGIYEKSDDNFVRISHEKNGNFTFSNEFNLKAFPFDRQKLIIKIVDPTRIAEMLDLFVDNYSIFELNEFKEEGNILEWKIVDTDIRYYYEDDPTSKQYAQGVKVSIDIERNYQYYIFKIICPIILILLVSWSVFWIHPKELESKLTITIVCLLSLIAYNFVIDNDLPKLSYLTIIDYIVLLSYAFATFPNFISIYSYGQYQKRNKKWIKVDSISRIYGPLIYLLLIFTIISVNSFNNENTAAFLGFLR